MSVKLRMVKGKYRLLIDHKGDRKYITIGTDKKKATQAKKIAEQQIVDKQLNLKPAVVSPTLAAFVATWMTRARARCKTSTADDYEYQLTHYVLPTKLASLDGETLGDVLVKDLTSDHCKDLFAFWAKHGLMSNSLAQMRRVLTTCLMDATKYLPVNPCIEKGMTTYCTQPDEIVPPIKPLSKQEVAAFLTAAKTFGISIYAMFVTFVRTGLRIGEVLALEWDAVGLDEHYLIARQSRNRESVVTATKTNRVRRVDLSDQATAVLRELRAHQKAEAFRKGTPMPTLVFVTKNGQPYEQDHIRQTILPPVLTKAGVRQTHPHNLRHTFASELLRGGAPVNYVKEQLGHVSIAITVDIYSHLIPGENRNWVNGLDDATKAPSRSAL